MTEKRTTQNSDPQINIRKLSWISNGPWRSKQTTTQWPKSSQGMKKNPTRPEYILREWMKKTPIRQPQDTMIKTMTTQKKKKLEVNDAKYSLHDREYENETLRRPLIQSMTKRSQQFGDQCWNTKKVRTGYWHLFARGNLSNRSIMYLKQTNLRNRTCVSQRRLCNSEMRALIVRRRTRCYECSMKMSTKPIWRPWLKKGFIKWQMSTFPIPWRALNGTWIPRRLSKRRWKTRGLSLIFSFHVCKSTMIMNVLITYMTTV